MSLLTNTSPAFEFGPIYVREQGQLRLLNGASSLKVNSGRSKSVRLFQKGFTVNLCIEDGDKPNTCRTDHIVFTYTKEGNLRYSPKSLFDVVLAFIADNIQHVDSLIGFPEQIAEKLFIAVEARKKFVDSSTSAKALFIFNEAYGSLVLQSLCLRERFMLVSEKLKEIQSFRGLRRLDLSSCKLGDDHELLRHLTSEPLMSLALLYLGDNGLSDCGLQKMTAPVRVMRKGLGNLEVLDLSGNPRISGRGMPYVCCFSKLRALNISGTGVTVVYQWERLCDRQRRKVGCRTVAQRFYGTNKFISLGTDGFSNTVQIKDPVKMQFLRKPNQDLSVQSPTSSTIGPCKRGTDRADEIDCSSPPVKCKRTELTLDDWDMLNCY
ncbi:leucine-rich repeat-containing protein 42 isoform X2 [Pristis pectinata]|uniref:leucine-rich repeat-containing protein 42 isoform X2 n=1 Tax=Pristis pectinata TaxID=685728 RepID=UPI00223E3BD8|nr:leucine-rich repeat-containing protein 42 isoform X2 [Pristis pectinata]